MEWLRKQPSYTKFAPVRQKFTRNRIMTWGIDYLFQADLVDISVLSKSNRGIKWLLIVICTFSKFLMVRPLKNKSQKEMAFTLELIFSTRSPLYLQTDLGTEFWNAAVRDVLKKYDVFHYAARNIVKAAIAER